jgi:predicted RNA-binding Zn ribbon-like protein
MKRDTPETIELWGGTLCLDFANSVDRSERDEPIKDDVLTEPGLLVRWGRRTGVLVPTGGPEIGDRELGFALALREAVYGTFAAIARDETPDGAGLALIASTHAEGVAHAELAPAGDAWGLDWPAGDPRRVRYTVSADAIALLADAERLARVSRCPGRNCGWLFVNASGRRRWCSMSACGSREKMRRAYRRRSATGGLGASGS